MILIPYVKVNEEWTIPDELMRGLYQQMRKEGTDKTVFYSGTVKTEEEWMSMAKSGRTHTAVLLQDSGAPAAIGWLNNYSHKSAHAHWLCFKGIWGTPLTKEAIDKSLRYWFHFHADGDPLFDVLLGIWPEDNKYIRKFAEEAGFTVIGTIPSLLYNYWEDRTVGAVFSYIERGKVI